jgi:hypothetical protein
MLGQNHFAEPNWACFDFLSSNFLLQGHILSTGGAALKTNLISPHMGSPEKITYSWNFALELYLNDQNSSKEEYLEGTSLIGLKSN